MFQGEDPFSEISPCDLSARDERLVYAGRSKNMKFGKMNQEWTLITSFKAIVFKFLFSY